MRIYNAVIGGYDLKDRWQVYEYLVRAEDADDAAEAFGHQWQYHGFGETAIRAHRMPEIRLLKGMEEVEFPADHRIRCISHPDIHVGWSSYIAVPAPLPGSAVLTKDNRPEVKLTFGRHAADTCWLATDEQARKVPELDAWSLWAHFGMRRTGGMTEHSLAVFGLIPEQTND